MHKYLQDYNECNQSSEHFQMQTCVVESLITCMSKHSQVIWLAAGYIYYIIKIGETAKLYIVSCSYESL